MSARGSEIDALTGSRSTVPSTVEVLTEIWRREFGPKGRDPDANILYASVGLRRLVRFQKRVTSVFGVTVPPTALLRLGTIAALADAIDRGVWPEPSPLILLRDGRPDLAVYLPASASGFILELCELGRLIDFPGQVWGLQLPGLDGEAAPLATIVDIARHYADSILERPPVSVCHLIGYSAAGLVIVEMTRILEARGRKVDLLLMIDSTAHETYWPLSQWCRFALHRAIRRVRQMRGMRFREAAPHLAGRIHGIFGHIGRRFGNGGLDDAGRPPKRSKYYVGGLEPDFQRVRDSAIIAYESHRPRPIDRKLVLFKAMLGDPYNCDPVGLWKRLAPELEVITVPGSHVTMIRKPFVQQLAAEISRRIR